MSSQQHKSMFGIGLKALLAAMAACACDCAAGPRPPAPVKAVVPVPATAATVETTVEQDWSPVLRQARPASWYQWWEAENASSDNFPEHHPFEPSTPAERELLSAGSWIGAVDPGQTLFLEYDVEVPRRGTYQLYVRKFWAHGPFRWRFGEQEWRSSGRDVKLLDSSPLRKHVEANWVHLGQVELNAAKHRLRVELLELTGPSAFDAFVLAEEDFSPRGKLKPTESYAVYEPGFQVFDPPRDDFSASAIDLRRLNQARAGEDGPVVAADGELRFQNTGEPVRFWGVNAGADLLYTTPRQMQRFARRQAKFGVNLVRMHTAMFSEHDFRKLDSDKLARLHQLTSALREQGVYLALSIYFPLWLSLKPDDGFVGYAQQHPFSLAYFNPEFQEVQRQWWRQLLSSPNPATGLSLAEDPTLAIVELVNEDSTLFWTFKPYETIPEAQTAVIERQFGEWLDKKYGSLKQALQHWASAPVRGDQLEQRRLGLLNLWEIVQRRDQRAQDTAQFLAGLMRNYYSSMHNFLRQELGARTLTVCSNWQTADVRILGPLDDWANSVCDVMDRHAYLSGKHEGDAATYDVRAGQTTASWSSLRLLEREAAANEGASLLPLLEPHINDKPSFVSELSWPWPNRFRAEAPLLTAVYGGLHGLDAVAFFATSDASWASSLTKFQIADPTIVGQFPAAALAFRTAMLAEAEPVARVAISSASLQQLKGSPVAVEPSLDALRAVEVPKSRANGGASVDPLAQLVGPVDIELGAAHDGLEQTPLGEFLDRDRRVVRSRTGQASWDYDVGVLQVTAPAFEAAVGFLGAQGLVSLPHLNVSVRNEYAAVSLIALDGKPLAASQRMLLQVATEAKNRNWALKAKGDQFEILNAGGPPILIRDAEGTVELRRADARAFRTTALDANGYGWRRALGGAGRISLLPGVLYYLIERNEL